MRRDRRGDRERIRERERVKEIRRHEERMVKMRDDKDD